MDPKWVRWSEVRRLSAGLSSGPLLAFFPLHGATSSMCHPKSGPECWIR